MAFPTRVSAVAVIQSSCFASCVGCPLTTTRTMCMSQLSPSDGSGCWSTLTTGQTQQADIIKIENKGGKNNNESN